MGIEVRQYQEKWLLKINEKWLIPKSRQQHLSVIDKLINLQLRFTIDYPAEEEYITITMLDALTKMYQDMDTMTETLNKLLELKKDYGKMR